MRLYPRSYSVIEVETLIENAVREKNKQIEALKEALKAATEKGFSLVEQRDALKKVKIKINNLIP